MSSGITDQVISSNSEESKFGAHLGGARRR